MVGGAVVLCVYSTEDVREVSVPSSQFCCELKTALKSQVIYLNLSRVKFQEESRIVVY